MIKLPSKLRDPLIFLGLLIVVPSCIYFISMNFGDQRIHIEKKQWNPAEAADQGIDPQQLKKADEYIESRLPLARGMIIIKNGKTVYEKYYWKGGPQETNYLHSLNRPILHALVGIAIEKEMLTGRDQPLIDFFPNYFFKRKDNLIVTIDDLLRVKAPLIWGKGAPEYWELFYSADRVASSIRVLMPDNGRTNPAANFAANFLLAEVIRKVSQMSVFEFADEYLFKPIGITTMEEIKEKDTYLEPFIGFELRTLDLAKFGFLVMQEGAWQDKQVIPGNWARNIKEELYSVTENASWGGWQLDMIGNTESLIVRGESGQYIVISPGLDLLVAVSSKSLFPLSENSGYDHLFQLIFEAVEGQPDEEETAVDPDERPYYEPNFVYATEVPDEIRQFFYDFARDIATQDINRILYHYAKGYENKGANMGWLDRLFLKGGDYRSMYGYWKKIFFGGSGELEFVQIEKLRIDNNRAYLRGNLKYSYANMNEGSIGWFPLENLIKLRGRWLWLGSPEYGEILDRDEYFDAEIPIDLKEFINDCGSVLTIATGKNNTSCFSEGFLHNGLGQSQLRRLLQPFKKKKGEMKLHITRAEQSDNEGVLEGYMENSLIGTINLPPGIRIVNEGSKWKWSGNGVR